MLNRILEIICRSSARHPFRWLLVTALLSIPAVSELGRLKIDTNLKRLLPEESRAVLASEELEKLVGDGGHFSMIFAGSDHEVVFTALKEAAKQVEAMGEVQSVTYRYPLDFIERFKYLLLPSESLQKLFDTLVRWKDEASPFGLKLDSGGGGASDDEARERLDDYESFTEFHQSEDGTQMGMLIRAKKGATSLGATRKLFRKLDALAQKVAKSHAVWGGVSGSLRNKVDIYDQIIRDLNVSGTFALIAILATLLVSFRSFTVLPVLVYPLVTGLLWSFALVPSLVGSLNLITSFLLMVLFGMGIDYSIHLVKRFQQELLDRGTEAALFETYRSTGYSVGTSGLTTALSLSILSFSGFRGFSEFGIISGTSLMMILGSMFLVLPSALVVGARWGLVKAYKSHKPQSWKLMPPLWFTWALAAVVLVAAVYAVTGLEFDYDFGNLKVKVAASQEVKRHHQKVYHRGSMSPAALYVAKDMDALDRGLDLLEETRKEQGEDSIIGRVGSLRDYVPGREEAAKRVELFSELQDRLKGRWIRRVKEEDRRRWIEDARDFKAPPAPPTREDLPAMVRRGLETRDGSGGLVIAVFPSRERKHGKNAMAFTKTLYSMKMPAGVRGPTGETPIFAEVLWLVTSEGPWLVAITFLGIFLLVLLDRRSFFQTLWVLMPLVAGLLLTLGSMVALGWKLNFFNIVVLPALLGISVDQGIHFYRRWRELGCVETTQDELLEPITACTFTTIMGYAGMTLAHHPGLEAIGKLALLGLSCCWLTAVVLLPGLLALRERRRDT